MNKNRRSGFIVVSKLMCRLFSFFFCVKREEGQFFPHLISVVGEHVLNEYELNVYTHIFISIVCTGKSIWVYYILNALFITSLLLSLLYPIIIKNRGRFLR